MFYRSSHLRCSLKTMFLLISPNLQENTCAGVFFKVAALKACYFINFIKKVTPALMFSCEFCETFKNTFSVEHLRTAAFVNNLLKSWKSFKISLTLSKRRFLTPLVPRFFRFLFTTDWSTLKLTSVFTTPEKFNQQLKHGEGNYACKK